MNRFQIEKRIWQAQIKRLRIRSLGTYERQARNSLLHLDSVRDSTASAVRSKLNEKSVVLFGDDALVIEDQKIMYDFYQALPKRKRPRFVVTDRKISFPFPIPTRKLTALKSLIQSDRNLIRFILRNRRERIPLWVWTGALRLFHLQRELKKQGIEGVCIHLEPSELRWRQKRDHGWLKSEKSSYFYVKRSPLLSLSRYRTGCGPILDPKKEFRKSVQLCCKKLRVTLPKRRPNLFSIFESRDLERLTPFLMERGTRMESAVVPKDHTVFLATLDRGEIAEEAAHFVRLWSVKGKEFGFYRTVVEEAFAFMFSLMVDPIRKIPKLSNKSQWGEVHYEGYRLGKKLKKSWNQSAAIRQRIRSIWKNSVQTEKDAYRTYFQLEMI